MSLTDYWRLLEVEQEPRNRLLWLLLGAGGLRISEALNMFSTDVYLQETTQQALIALANPLEGAVKLPHGATTTRLEYLRSEYGLAPRCSLAKSDPLHAGWKGILEGGLRDDALAELEDWARYRWTPVECDRRPA
jgi:hypothetical protein